MVRDDLYITVPSFFKCPISLDVMKSPVSLCTGVTYDRASIQRWLDNGNNTCPATMQVLHSKEFVPNRTLQRLIQIWSESARHLDDSPESPSESVSTLDQAGDLIKELENCSENCFDSLSNLVCFAGKSEENRKFLAKIDGFVQILVDFLGNVEAEKLSKRNLNFVEQIVRVLDIIINENKDYEQAMNLILNSNHDCLSSILIVLQQGSVESRIASARVLESIAINAESKVLIAEKDGLLSELLSSVTPDTDESLIEPSISCLITISMPKRIKIKLLHLGAIKSLRMLLTNPNSRVSTVEKVLKLLETVSSCKEGWEAICEDEMCVSAIVQRILKVSGGAAEHAVTVLWSVCYLFRDPRAQEAVVKSNGLAKILLLMQSNCSPPVRQMAADLIKVFRVSSKSCLSCYDTNTTHIMPF